MVKGLFLMLMMSADELAWSDVELNLSVISCIKVYSSIQTLKPYVLIQRILESFPKGTAGYFLYSWPVTWNQVHDAKPVSRAR